VIALLITGCTCAMTFGGGMLALRMEASRSFVLAFAAGALVTTALMNVIPDALELLTRSGVALHHHHLMFASSLGFLSFYLLNWTTHSHVDSHGAPSSNAHYAGLWGVSGIGIHSLVDGFAIGEAFSAGAVVGWIVALAVTVHKFADGVSAVGVLVSTGRGPRVTRTILLLIALAPLVGLAVQELVPLPLSALALVLGWFSGVFLYLGSSVLIPAAHNGSGSRWLPLATLAGVAFVYLVSRISE
jgi:ZIP family zinc transporter